MEKLTENYACPVTATIELIGGRWKTIILYTLSPTTRRFGEIAARMPSISRKVLTEQLRELEADGLISRKEYKEMPPRVEYSLTELGNSLAPILEDLAAWGRERVLTRAKNPALTIQT
jgi:DNA-binding HxlR family transcriptional regulator